MKMDEKQRKISQWKSVKLKNNFIKLCYGNCRLKNKCCSQIAL